MPPQLGLEAVLPFTCTSKTFQPCSTRVVPIDLEAHRLMVMLRSLAADGASRTNCFINSKSFQLSRFPGALRKVGKFHGLVPLVH